MPTLSRRHFLRTAAAAGLAGTTLDAFAETALAGKPLRVGLIGSGWYGKSDVFRLLQVAPAEVVAVCDPDRLMREDAAQVIGARQASRKIPEAYGDYRELLKQHELDIAVIGTPDHWHTLPAIAAMEAGAHVYLQKPVSVDVLEGEAILAAARRLKRTVQVGTQRRSTPHLIEAKEKVIDAGLLGKIGHAEMFSYYHMRRGGKGPDVPVPEHLDWEMWTGPAPMRPYHEGIHPGSWRSYWEYGNGFVGDMCVHMLDMVRWLLDLGWPKRITSSGGVFMPTESRANVTDTQTASFDFGDFTATWQHRTWGAPTDPRYPWGAVLYGEKGTLRAGVQRYEFIPMGQDAPTLSAEPLIEKEKYPDDATEKRIEIIAASATRGHMRNFLAAIQTGERPVADILQGHTSSASCILANLAMKTGRALTYDPATRTVPGDAEATGLLRRAYRAPWVHPAQGI